MSNPTRKHAATCAILFAVGLPISLHGGESVIEPMDLRVLPAGAIARLGELRLQNPGGVSQLVVSPDNRFLALGLSSIAKRHVLRAPLPDAVSSVLIADGKTGRHQRRILIRGGAIGALAFSRDSKTLAAGVGEMVFLFDAATGKLRWKRRIDLSHVERLQFSSRGTILYAGGRGSGVSLINAENGKVGKHFTPPLPPDTATKKQKCKWAVMLPDETTILCRIALHFRATPAKEWQTDFDSMRAYDADTAKLLHARNWTNRPFAIAPVGGAIAYGVLSLNSIDGRTGKRRLYLYGLKSGISDLFFSSDGEILGSVDNRARMVHFWNAATGKKSHNLDLTEAKFDSEKDIALAYTSDSRHVWITDGSLLRKWDGRLSGAVPVFSELPVFPGHRDTVRQIAFSPDGKKLTTVSDERVCTWDAKSWKETRFRRWSKAMRDRFFAVSWKHGVGVVRAGSHTLALADLKSGNVKVKLSGKHSNPDAWCKLAPDESKFIVAERRNDKTVLHVYATGNGKLLANSAIERPLRRQYTAFGGNLLAGWNADGQVFILDSATGKEKFCFGEKITGFPDEWHLGQERLKFSPNEKYLLAVRPGEYADGRQFRFGRRELAESLVCIWDVKTGRPVCEFTNPKMNAVTIVDMAFSPDNRLLAVANANDKKTHLWEIASGTRSGVLTGHRQAVFAMCFSPDGARLATGSGDTTVIIWDMRRPLHPMPTERKFNENELLSNWNKLRQRDTEQAAKALWTFIYHPKQTLPLLKKHLAPVAKIQPRRINKWIEELDNNRFRIREKALLNLERAGEAVVPMLRRELDKKITLEAHLRIRQLLDKIAGKTINTEQLRELRALEILERIGNQEARALLRLLSSGEPQARLTREARECLLRLNFDD